MLLSLVYALLASTLSVTVALPELRRSVPMSDVVTSLHGSFFGWASIAGGILGAPVLGRLGRSRTLIGAVLAMAGGALLFSTGHVVSQTLFGAALIGFGGAAAVVTIPSMVADVFGPRRSLVLTRLNIAPGAAGLAFPLMVAAAPSLGLTWRWIVGAVPVVFAIGFFVVLRSTVVAGSVDVQPRSIRASLALIRHPPFRHRFLLQALNIGTEFSFGVWAVTYLREVGGASRSVAPIGAAAWAIGMMLSRGLVPRSVRRFGAHLEMACFLGIVVWSGVLFAVPSVPLKLLAISGVAFSAGPMYTLGVERLFLIGEGDADTISALAALSAGIAITLGPLTVGVLGDLFGLRVAMFAIPAAALVGVLLAVIRWGGEGGMLGRDNR